MNLLDKSKIKNMSSKLTEFVDLKDLITKFDIVLTISMFHNLTAKVNIINMFLVQLTLPYSCLF